MTAMNMREMMEAGAHFGHQTHHWDPRMKPYIFSAKNGIHIIDLQKTVQMCRAACEFLTKVVSEGGDVLFVGTKRQAQMIVAEEARRCSMFYVTHRWLGGTLTNFRTIRASIERLKTLEKRRDEEGLEGLTKKEKLGVEREIQKLTKSLGGIKEMTRLPAAVFILDPHMEQITLKEAILHKIPVVALGDTNCNPEGIDYLIPGNDDAIKSIRLFTATIAAACLDGLTRRQEVMRQGAAEAPLPREVVGARGRAFVSKPESYENEVKGEYRAGQAAVEALKVEGESDKK